MMYYCKDCGNTFDEPNEVEEYHPEVHASEWFSECPFCGSGEFVESDGTYTIAYSYTDGTGKRRNVSEGEVFWRYKDADEKLSEIVSDLIDQGYSDAEGQIKEKNG